MKLSRSSGTVTHADASQKAAAIRPPTTTTTSSMSTTSLGMRITLQQKNVRQNPRGTKNLDQDPLSLAKRNSTEPNGQKAGQERGSVNVRYRHLADSISPLNMSAFRSKADTSNSLSNVC